MKTYSRWFPPLVLGLVLTACNLLSPPAPTSTPTQTLPPPTATRVRPSSTPRLPTPTAQIFQLISSSTPLPTWTPAPTLDRYVFGPSRFPDWINPLTGLQPADISRLDRRPMVIKVSNFPRSIRPQWGLSLADHVFEYYLEYGLTRFAAVYLGNDASRVGPVRSARLFDDNLIRIYRSTLTFSGADDRILDHLLENSLGNRIVIPKDDNCPPLCVIGPKNDYNNVYANTLEIQQYLAGRGINIDRQNLDGLLFDQDLPRSDAIPAGRITVHFSFDSYHAWEFDLNSGRYLRFQETRNKQDAGEQFTPHMDALTGAQIAADNILILYVPHDYYVKTKTSEILQMDLTESGIAYALRDGLIFELRWERMQLEGPLHIKFANGRPYPLKPGNIWFEVLTSESYYEQDADRAYTFYFAKPEPPPTPTPTATPLY